MTDLPYNSKPVVGPVLRWSGEEVETFDRLLARARDRHGGLLDCNPGIQNHRFVSYATERSGLLAHGSSRGGLDRLEPGDQGDLNGRPVRAVFASSDGIWAMFFAILDWSRVAGTFNGTRRFNTPDGDFKGYVFTVLTNGQPGPPFHPGWIYLAERTGFSMSLHKDGADSDEWLSPSPVVPLARLSVQPEDFPFLAGVTVHESDQSQSHELE